MAFLGQKIAIFSILLFSLFSLAPKKVKAEAINQSNHTKILFFEGWNGAYFESDYERDYNKTVFSYCDYTKRKSKFPSCEKIGEVPYDRLPKIQETLLLKLRTYRDQVAYDADSSFWYFLSGGAKKSSNVAAVNQVIEKIEKLGLDQWILLQKVPDQDLPTFSSPTIAKEFADLFKEVFEGSIDIPKCANP